LTALAVAPDEAQATQTCDTIYEVQYTTDPGDGGTYPSPCEDQEVTLTGIVYARYSGKGFFIAEAEGAWHGIYAYYPGGDLPAIGDEVEVTGTVKEYYGITELSEGVTYSVLSSGNALYGPTIVQTADIPFNNPTVSEEYEDVFVEARDVLVTAGIDTHGIWTFSDGSGGSAKADDWGYHLEPDVDEEFAIVRGALVYDFDEYKVQPRDAADVVPYSLSLTKSAPANLNSGELFTYTLRVENYTGVELTDASITDTVPADTTFAYALDGGMESGGVVSWTLPSLAHTGSITVQFAVTATSGSAVIYNHDYAVSAGNYATPTFGSQVLTVVGTGLSIHYIQGTGEVSPLEGQNVEDVPGIVTAVHSEGFYMQEPNPDGDVDTSEGIYVHLGSAPPVSDGDAVEVDGLVTEYFGLTELTNATVVTVPNGATITPTTVTLPVADRTALERYEGMLVTLPQELTVTEVYNLGRYGEVMLAEGGRLFNPTNVITPGIPAQDLQEANDLRRLVLDDGSSESYPHPIPYPSPELSATNTLRVGYVVTDVTGVLSYGHDAYRLHPTQTPTFTPGNTRTAAPEPVGGSLQVASFNVLNYFNGDGQGGGFPTSRGADTYQEFLRQEAKIVEAILDLDADIIGLMEIENDGYGPYSAIQDLVDALNAEAPEGDIYAFVDPGVSQIGDDEIAVGLIYNTATVSPDGDPAILDSESAVPGTTFDDTKNRPVLAQAFSEEGTGATLTVAVNHLKSKGSGCGAGDDAPAYEGGNCNLTRTEGAAALAAWLVTDPTGSGDPDSLIIGDLNAYAMEDPITTLEDAGYADLIEQYEGQDAYSYVFMGQAGYLDHALANPSLSTQVTGATVWHINADEPRALDYNTDEPNDEPDHYAPNPYRASDHDPVLVGLDLDYDVTFVYHDLENVVPPTVTLHVAGDFNGWSTTATPMTTDGRGVYTASITTGDPSLASDYKYVAGDSWDDGRGDILNAANRHFDVSGATTLDDYRDIAAGYLVLSDPASATVEFGVPSPVISGEAWYMNIPAFLENQVLSAQLGYGTHPDPANWTWVDANFAGRNGNNDVFTATLEPAAVGTYSYTLRVDGNWGADNPNSLWAYGDLDGVHPGDPFELDQVGTLTVLDPPSLALSKSVTPETDVDLGEVVTYTLSLNNGGVSTAYDVTLSDTLPTSVAFGGFAMGTNVTPAYADGVVSWNGDLPAGVQPIAIVYTATLGTDYGLYGDTITNTASYGSDNGGSGQDQAAFTVIGPPDFGTSVKVSGRPGARVMPGDHVTYTVTVSNTGQAAASVILTDTLGDYYEVVDAMAFTEGPTGTLTWEGEVPVGARVELQFVARVVSLGELPDGTTSLANTVTIDDGVALFSVTDDDPPFVVIYQNHLPMIRKVD
jgi:hypothetical protein